MFWHSGQASLPLRYTPNLCFQLFGAQKTLQSIIIYLNLVKPSVMTNFAILFSVGLGVLKLEASGFGGLLCAEC